MAEETFQVGWWLFGAFAFGLFVGGNLGVLLMCILQVAGDKSRAEEELDRSRSEDSETDSRLASR